MNVYRESLQLVGLAILALAVSYLWDDASLLASLAFLTLIILAAQSALSVSKTFRSRIKLLSVFSVILAVLVVLGFTVMNPPQCPISYTQHQINAANGKCIIGANIGIGLYFMFIVIPAALLVAVLWIKTLASDRKPRKKL
jgi:hypothetical protein